MTEDQLIDKVCAEVAGFGYGRFGSRWLVYRADELWPARNWVVECMNEAEARNEWRRRNVRANLQGLGISLADLADLVAGDKVVARRPAIV